MLLGMKRDVKQIVGILNSDFHSPAGPIQVERLIRKHLPLFEDLRDRGLTWEQVSRLLAAAGIAHGDGQAFSPSHLRGVFGRQRARLAQGRRLPATDAGHTVGSGASYAGKVQSGVHRPPDTGLLQSGLPHADATRATPRPAMGREHKLAASETPAVPDESHASARSRDRAALLALMRQSATARRTVG